MTAAHRGVVALAILHAAHARPASQVTNDEADIPFLFPEMLRYFREDARIRQTMKPVSSQRYWRSALGLFDGVRVHVWR